MSVDCDSDCLLLICLPQEMLAADCQKEVHAELPRMARLTFTFACLILRKNEKGKFLLVPAQTYKMGLS